MKELIYVKNYMYRTKSVIALERFCIVTNSHAVSFSIKMCFDETNNAF